MAETIITKFDPDQNFWALNPALKFFPEFKKLHKRDRAAKKIKSSKHMWALAMLCDVHEGNPFRNIPEDERMMLIKTDYLEDPKFDWESDENYELIEAYRNYCLSALERHLVILENKLTERGKYLRNTEYRDTEHRVLGETGKVAKIPGNFKDLDAMFGATKKVRDELEDVKNSILEERAQAEIHGGGVESMFEEGMAE